MKLSRWALLFAVAPVAACGSFGKAMNAHTDVVAEAAGKELKVDEAATLLAGNPQIPTDPQAAALLAGLWVDYTLLGTAIAEDTTLAVLDMDKLMEPAREQLTIQRLLTQVVRPDTSFTDAELMQRWNTEGPGMEIRARHILLRTPTEATPAQRDSVRKLAESLRTRAAGGEDFAKLATQFSADGSAQQGGDLGFFGRGRMVAPFEEAAFKLEPGQVSQVVESPFGLHVIKVEERRQQEIGPRRDEFRQYLVGRAGQDAIKKYVDSLSAASKLVVQPGAPKAVRELAQQSTLKPRGRAADRSLASYRGGEVTLGELAEYLQTLPPGVDKQIQQAQDPQLEEAVKGMATQELLLREAKTRNVALSAAATDSIRRQMREGIRELVRNSGFAGRRIPKGSAGDAAIAAQVKDMLQRVVAGTAQPLQLGELGAALRNSYGYEVNEGTFAKVVEKMKAIRATQPAATPPAGAPGMQQGPPPTTPPPGGTP